MSVAALIRDMIAEGATPQLILLAVEAVEARDNAASAERAKAAERKRRQRDRDRDMAVTVTGQSQDIAESTPALSPPNDNNLTPPIPTPVNKTPARKETPFSDDWVPILTPAAQKTVDGWPPGMFERQLAAFRDHAADKGRKSKDWQAAFRTWIGKADEWKPKNGTSNRANYQSGKPQNGFAAALRYVADGPPDEPFGFNG